MHAGQRAAGLVSLALIVTAAHLWVAGRALPERLGADTAAAAAPAIDVSFVRELLPATPPAAVPAPKPRAAARAPSPAVVAPAASAPSSAPNPVPAEPPPAPPEPLREAPPEPSAVALEAQAVAAAASAAVARAAAAEALSTAPPTAAAATAAGTVSATAFEWPPSTRLQYDVTGNFRGPVEGQASVEWRRQGSRYQVDLQLVIGPSFAPLASRSIISEGEITPAGLHPTRYDETTRALLREPRRLIVQMDGEQVVLAGGRTLARPPGLQDSASQFVQLTWLFTTDPSRLREGQLIELPLALPRRLARWVYEVGATEAIDTPAGPVPAVHVLPRRDALQPRQIGELAAEVWFAPSLQYLPVRMLIRQDAETFVELRLAGLPQQAVEPPASAPTGR